LLVFGHDGRLSPQVLGLEPESSLAPASFDGVALHGWLMGQGAETPDSLASAKVELDGLVALRARAACTV